MNGLRAARVTAPDRIRAYLSDESASFRGHAEELLLPATEREVVEVLQAANRSRTLLTVSGAGTSITGSRVPTSGGAVLSTERMVAVSSPAPAGFETVEGDGFRILLNARERLAVVPPAVTLAGLEAVLARRGLLYPPDPTEMTAMVGGTVATNASGARSFRYGPTRAWVRRIRVALPTGEVAELRRGDSPARGGVLDFRANGRTVRLRLPSEDEYRMPRTKNAAGLYLAPDMEPMDLFIGCEGILGIVTEVEVALVERPAQTLTVVAYFASRDGALGFVDAGISHARAADAFLSLEYFDGRSLEFLRQKYADIPGGAAAAVLFEAPYGRAGEHNPYPGDALLDGLQRLLDAHGAASNWAVPGTRREDIRRFRHALPERVNEYVRTRVGKIGTDMAVPRERLREMMDAYERESTACGVRFLLFGHIGDGHVHLNYLPENEAEAARARAAYARLARTAVRLGGTISAEHGVGKKTIPDEAGRPVPYLQVLYGVRGLQIIADVKRELDPNAILNIGNMVPAEMLA